MPTVSSLQQLTQASNIASDISTVKTKTSFTGNSSRPSLIHANPFTKMMSTSKGMNLSPVCKCALISTAPLDAIFCDIDGTMIDSDPIHFRAFEQLLVEAGYNGGVLITEEFYIREVCGKHNDLLGPFLSPNVAGLNRMFKYIKERGLEHAAVTYAPWPSAKFLLSKTGLGDKFETVVIGIEWGRPKPFPDPYLKALKVLRVTNKRAMVFEDSCAGIKAGVAAGLPVVGVTLRNPPEILMETGAVMTISDYNDPKLWVALGELDKVAADANVTVGV